MSGEEPKLFIDDGCRYWQSWRDALLGIIEYHYFEIALVLVFATLCFSCQKNDDRRGMLKNGATLAVTLLIAATLAEHSSSTSASVAQKEAALAVEADKRPQTAYLHDREDLNKYQESHESGGKQLGVPSFLLDQLLTEELEKRASMRGFQGVRGKKSELDYEPNAAYYYDDYYEKRAPMGFQGMRGKKSSLDEDELYEKRAPMGFQGMRGKKSFEEALDEYEKRAMMGGFQGVRGKKADDYEVAEQQRQLLGGEPQQLTSGTGEWRKRTPMGFQGMRGRKSSFLEDLDDLEKRALLGFHGMRGKKDMPYEREYPQRDADGYVQKRPMMMGFHGMRGKRSTDYYGSSLVGRRYSKRSPYRFFDTRGKKNPRWEMRGKFVGVRGKKWTQAPRPLLSIYDELALVNGERTRH